MDLSGQVVLVVGGAGGIGLGIAKAFAAEGCRVALADVSEGALVNATKAAKGDSPFVWRTCDITEREQVSQLFHWLDDELGPIDILVNSAGVNVANRMMVNIDPADFDHVMEVNTTGTFNCIHAALGVMRQRSSGLIVNIVSLAGKTSDASGGSAVLCVKICHRCSRHFCQSGGMRKRYQGNKHLSR